MQECVRVTGAFLDAARLCLQDRYADTHMLDISDVELHDLQLFDDDPVVVVRFNAQQINCFRDKF